MSESQPTSMCPYELLVEMPEVIPISMMGGKMFQQRDEGTEYAEGYIEGYISRSNAELTIERMRQMILDLLDCEEIESSPHSDTDIRLKVIEVLGRKFLISEGIKNTPVYLRGECCIKEVGDCTPSRNISIAEEGYVVGAKAQKSREDFLTTLFLDTEGNWIYDDLGFMTEEGVQMIATDQDDDGRISLRDYNEGSMTFRVNGFEFRGHFLPVSDTTKNKQPNISEFDQKMGLIMELHNILLAAHKKHIDKPEHGIVKKYRDKVEKTISRITM